MIESSDDDGSFYEEDEEEKENVYTKTSNLFKKSPNSYRKTNQPDVLQYNKEISQEHISRHEPSPRNIKRKLLPNPSIIRTIEDKPTITITEDHKRNLQIYVFVCRLIAFAYSVKCVNSDQASDNTQTTNKTKHKLSKADINLMKKHFQRYLSTEVDAVLGLDFRNVIQIFYKQFLSNENFERLALTGSLSFHELHEIFHLLINQEYFQQNETEFENDAENYELQKIWMNMFDLICERKEVEKTTITTENKNKNDESSNSSNSSSNSSDEEKTQEDILQTTQEELYILYQNILNIEKHEHQIIYNACQLNNKDEQLACLKRELATMQDQFQSINKNMPEFVAVGMETIYRDEMMIKIEKLQSFENIITKLYDDKKGVKRNKVKRVIQNVVTRFEKKETDFFKDLSQLDYYIKVTVLEATGVEKLKKKKLFVVMGVEGDQNMLQTDHVESWKPLWETHGDWTVNCPLIDFRLLLHMENSSIFSISHEKLIAKLLLKPYCGMEDKGKWYTMVKAFKDNLTEDVKLKLTLEMEKPEVVKKCGFLYCQGKNRWQKWKIRFFVLMQVSGYKMMLCTFTENRKLPYEWMSVGGYTVDFAQNTTELVGGRLFFQLTNIGDEVIFSSETDAERMNWIFKLYVATGQTYKPEMPRENRSASLEVIQANENMDRALKYGLGDIVQADPFTFTQAELFSILQQLTLKYQLNESFATRGALSSSQLFIMDEYCNRYHVRFFQRHIDYLVDLLTEANNGVMICPAVLDTSFSAIYPLMKNMKKAGVAITKDEYYRFEEITRRLFHYLYNQLINFQTNFPFCQPVGALQNTISLLTKVISYDTSSVGDVDRIIDGCMRKAALQNYNQICKKNNLTDNLDKEPYENENPLKTLSSLTQACLTEATTFKKYYGQVIKYYKTLFEPYDIYFWSLYTVDMERFIKRLTNCAVQMLEVFHVLQEHCKSSSSLNGSSLHHHLCSLFSPIVVEYMDDYDWSISKTLYYNMTQETYEINNDNELSCCKSCHGLYTQLTEIKTLITKLSWSDKTFTEHVQQRFKTLTIDYTYTFVRRAFNDFENIIDKERNDCRFVLPRKCSQIINAISYGKKQVELLITDLSLEADDKYHVNIKIYLTKIYSQIIEKLLLKFDNVLKNLLKCLTRYDADYPYRKIFQYIKDRIDATEGYFDFMTDNIVEVRRGIHDEILRVICKQTWWDHFCSTILAWLRERETIPLQPYQLQVLKDIVKSTENVFIHPSYPEFSPETADYKKISLRLMSEETLSSYYEN